MKLPEGLVFDVNLRVEQSGYELEVVGTGPEYLVRFPSLGSVFHFAFAFWGVRRMVPEGLVLRLKYRGFGVRYRT